MGAHAYWWDRGMTMPRHPPLSIKRNTVPLRGLVAPVYLYWYPVSSLRDRLVAACGQSLNSVIFLVILGPSLDFYSSYVYSFPFSSWKDRVSQFHCLFGPWNFFLLGGGGSSSSLDVAVLSLCLPWTQWLAPLESPDGPGRGSPGSGNGNWLISSCATPFNTVPFALLHSSASGIGNMWGHVRLGLLGKEQCCRCLFVQFPFISICWIHSPVSFEFHSVFFLISCFQIICSSPMDQSSTNSSIGSLSKEKTSSKSRNPFHLCYPEWITFQWSTSFHRMDIFWEWS